MTVPLMAAKESLAIARHALSTHQRGPSDGKSRLDETGDEADPEGRGSISMENYILTCLPKPSWKKTSKCEFQEESQPCSNYFM